MLYLPQPITLENNMNPVQTFEITSWEEAFPPALQNQAISALESGQVLFLPHLSFNLSPTETRFLSPMWSDGKSKNISYDGQAIKGAQGAESDLEQLKTMIARFANQSTRLVADLFPKYVPHLGHGRTSFRPFEVEQRASSYKKDDKRLHVDAFPSRPTHGERILRVFANINPDNRPRIWRVGEPFESLANHYLPQIKQPFPGSAWLMDKLGITKGRRSEYDHIMLNLHDKMKADMDYQKNGPQQELALPAGCAWIVFSDQVLHAAMSGQYMLEQTFHLPLTALHNQQTAPLKVLERLTGRPLVA